MDREHLEFIMRHQGGIGMGMAAFPVAHCDSEEALGSSESEQAAATARPRGKRARAAEVHNLSEKRRRCKINEKMKALQSLVPNSSKTDKASMLDDAIEYLKQLQLQVQMLSMRNGLYRPPLSLPRAPQPLPTPQMCTTLNQDNVEASNPTAALLPMNHILGPISGARHSFNAPNQDQQHHEPLVLQSVPCTTTPEPRFLLGSSQSSLQSLQLTASAEMILQDEVMLKHHLSSTQETTSIPVGFEMKPVVHETPQASAGHFDACSIWGKQPQDTVPNNTESIMFMPHLHRFQGGGTEPGLRAGSK
uniref:Uncharacterized protein n=1 Tax=Avena sativa TaxID=4498 RepID=A0ACD5Z9V5_AVESA